LSFELYDREYIPNDNNLTTAQVWIANAINAQLTGKDVIGLRDRLTEINKILSKISPNCSLSDPIDHIPLEALRSLFSETMGWGIKESKTTKILHKKRPALIPVLDSVLLKYCNEAAGGQLGTRGAPRAEKLLEAIKIFKVDLDTNLDILQHLGLNDQRANELSLVRRLELLIWAWAGYHRPKWMKEKDWNTVQKEYQSRKAG